MDMQKAWSICGEIVAREAFRSQLDAYVDAHCSEFDNSDENKLAVSYTHLTLPTIPLV